MTPSPPRRICVFCGSSRGDDPAFALAAQATGESIAARGDHLVYGGGGIGLMGVVADAVLDAGGVAIGVIPAPLATREVAHPSLTQLIVVETMHERKARMAELADAFLALPGGFGTFDELFEILTWAQLGIHRKPVGLLNIAGYFDPLLTLVEQSIERGFVAQSHRSFLFSAGSVADWFRQLDHHRAPDLPRRWIELQDV
jgi:uncharacterized protein (TIGR00730 family)